ncbi:MAG TPA: hypothetical protein VMY06_02610 [Sedimentisphaerales bacterium]|nr:hypothetical protein [Sedimentisphaerales bacterium]
MVEKNENQPKRSLSEQFEIGPPIGPPAEPAHKCFVCNGLDHRACGCEAKEMQKQIKHDDEAFRSRDILDEEAREKVPGRSAQEWAQTHVDQVAAILDCLIDVNSNLEILVKLQQERSDLLKDIQNASKN